MNKKVFTLLTVWLTLCGALFSSPAFAQTTVVANGTTVTSDAELNSLYNGSGFNFKAKSALGDDVIVQGNEFGDTSIWAEYSTGDVVAVKDDGELTVPAGMYFFTNYVEETDGTPDWLNSTLIAVSPTDVYESTDNDRSAGQGFQLVEVKGSEFIYYGNSSVPIGDDISIYNACFEVAKMNNATQDEDGYTYEYALYLKNFYFQPTATYNPVDTQVSSQDIEQYIGLNVISFDNSVQYVMTQPITTESRSGNWMNGWRDETLLYCSYVFAKASSGVLDGKDLLNETKTPAVYTIKFVSGGNLENKYLTVGAALDATGTATGFQWEAKGAAIADLTYPIFQYVITSVDETEVTFTNRETNGKFTAQLFPQDEDNQYTFNITKVNGEAVTNVIVHPFTVSTTASANTYEVKGQGSTPWSKDIIVELTKVTPDEYAGFLNVDDKSMYTLSFARDVNDTSNKLYMGVDGTYAVNANYAFPTSNTSAAQWQFVKSTTPTTISRTYVYYNPSTESIDDVADGDKVSAYTYSLKYIEDGGETIYYLTDKLGERTSLVTSVSDAQKFYIKENVDGSVSFFINSDSNNQMVFTNMIVAPNDKKASFGAKGFDDTTLNGIWLEGDDRPYIYKSAIAATDLKVYLDEDAADISWPAEEGHVTIMSDLGNYISMNEDRDGILINQNDGYTYWLYVTDEDAVTPSFYITRGTGSTDGERMFMFNPTDSVTYYVASGSYDRVYQWPNGKTKVMFKAATINETRDTLTMTVKGETKYVTADANDDNADIWGGIKRFKWQIVEAADADGYYRIRQINAGDNSNDSGISKDGIYLSSYNDRLTWSDKTDALLFQIDEVAAPTANESVTTSEVKIVATDGAVNIKNAAGKSVVISTILGQIVANETLTSDNATISVPSGIVIVSVEGEEAVKANVR